MLTVEAAPALRQVPKDWRRVPLLSVANLPSGQVNPLEMPFSEMFLVAPDHIESGTGRLLSKSTASSQGVRSGKYLFEVGDVIYSKIRPYLQKATLASFRGLSSADMYPLKPSKELDGRFLLAILLSRDFTTFAVTVSARSGIPKLNRDELGEYHIPLPPLPEQRAIAEVLGDVDALIAAQQKLIAKKRAIKTATMQRLLTGKQRLPGFGEGCGYKQTEIGVFPSDWAICTLGEVCRTITTGKLDANAMNQNGAYRFYTCAKNYSYIDEFAFDDEALLVSGNGANVGYIHYYHGKFNAYQRTYVLTSFLADIQFIRRVLERYLRKRIQSEVKAGNTPYITIETLTDMRFSLPPLSEQRTIAQVLTDIDTEIAALEKRLAKTKAIKQGMMQELLTGRTRLI